MAKSRKTTLRCLLRLTTVIFYLKIPTKNEVSASDLEFSNNQQFFSNSQPASNSSSTSSSSFHVRSNLNIIISPENILLQVSPSTKKARSTKSTTKNHNYSPSSIKQYADKYETFQDVALINSEFIYLASTDGVLYQFSRRSFNSKNNNIISPSNKFHYTQLQQHTRISTLFNLHSEKLNRPFVIEYCLINPVNKNQKNKNVNLSKNPTQIDLLNNLNTQPKNHLNTPNLVYKYFTADKSEKARAENAAKQESNSETQKSSENGNSFNSPNSNIAECHSQNFNSNKKYSSFPSTTQIMTSKDNFRKLDKFVPVTTLSGLQNSSVVLVTSSSPENTIVKFRRNLGGQGLSIDQSDGNANKTLPKNAKTPTNEILSDYYQYDLQPVSESENIRSETDKTPSFHPTVIVTNEKTHLFYQQVNSDVLYMSVICHGSTTESKLDKQKQQQAVLLGEKRDFPKNKLLFSSEEKISTFKLNSLTEIPLSCGLKTGENSNRENNKNRGNNKNRKNSKNSRDSTDNIMSISYIEKTKSFLVLYSRNKLCRFDLKEAYRWFCKNARKWRRGSKIQYLC